MPRLVAADGQVRYAGPDGAFAAANLVVSGRFDFPRWSSTPVECYGVVADWDEASGTLTARANFQGPFTLHSVAAASLGLPFSAFTRDAGVDVLSFGGTKNGALGAEAIVVLNPGASEGLKYLRKLNMQLASKMRFVSAQLIALLFRRPEHAELKRCAQRLDQLIDGYRSVVERYDLHAIDLDIENADLADSPSIERRAAAIAEVQDERSAAGEELDVWVTLP